MKTYPAPHLIFIDTETTGLDCLKHEMIEICILTEDVQGVMSSIFTEKFYPQHLETAEPKALEVNGFVGHEKEWEEASTSFDDFVANAIRGLMKDSIVVGQNTAFDLGFIEQALRQCPSTPKDWQMPRRVLDVQMLTHEHLVSTGLIKSYSLSAARKFFGWSSMDAHTALQDVLDTRRLYYTLMHATFLHRTWWRLCNWLRTLRG